MNKYLMAIIFCLVFVSCVRKDKQNKNHITFNGKDGEVKLIVLAPGHFHAGLLQKSIIPQINDSVYVYADSDDSAGLTQYLSVIESFNTRPLNPTDWKEEVYIGVDFLDKMISDKKGNVIILAGNNKEKTEYMHRAVNAGLNVLSDKPMAINQDDFYLLKEAYAHAKEKEVFLYDMMTERYDLLNIIERELINDNDFFGALQQGTQENPTVYMESVHHFYKEVSGKPLVRPAWYYDVEQQGEGIADVTTHLIDLVFWKCFPNQSIDYKKDIGSISSTHWPTDITLQQFTKSTQETVLPDYLHRYIDNAVLKVYANGTVNFNVKDHNIGLKVIWNYQAPKGGGDTFTSIIRGTKAVLRTVQSKEQNFVKQLYAQCPEGINEKEFSGNLQEAIDKLKTTYPYISFSPMSENGKFLINIPVENREGHESHFKYVAETFFEFLIDKSIPDWEISNTLAKYFITTRAVEVAKEKN